MKTKIVSYEINHCNSSCTQFYHNYDDNENCWCAALNKKIFDATMEDIACLFDDHIEREFPKDCPLKWA